MILILENSDLKPEARTKPLAEVIFWDADPENGALSAASGAEMVYVLRDGVARMLKSRNEPFKNGEFEIRFEHFPLPESDQEQ